VPFVAYRFTIRSLMIGVAIVASVLALPGGMRPTRGERPANDTVS
jgi:hypothetical protein